MLPAGPAGPAFPLQQRHSRNSFHLRRFECWQDERDEREMGMGQKPQCHIWMNIHSSFISYLDVHHIARVDEPKVVGAPQDPSSSALHWRREIWNGRMFSMTLGDCSKWNPKKTQMENGGSIFIYICINRPPTNKNIWNILEITGSTSLYYPCSWAMPYLQAWGLQRHDTSCAGSASKNETFSLPDLRTNTILDENGKIIFWKVYIYIHM